MRTYFVDYPRGFCNEYNVYVLELSNATRFRQMFPSAELISRAEAIRLGHRQPQSAEKIGEYWLGGFFRADHSESPVRIREILDACQEDTLSLLREKEMIAECGKCNYPIDRMF